MLGAVCISEEYGRKELSFEEILLDETQIRGEIWILKEALCKVGGVNYRLCAKRGYELLIRIAQEYTVLRLSGDQWEVDNITRVLEKRSWILWNSKMENEGIWKEIQAEDEIRTDCYLIGRYKKELLSLGYFDDAVCGIVSEGQETAIRCLEQMLVRDGNFYEIYDCTQPILIYRGDDTCHNVLDIFAESIGNALKELGQRVEYFDMSKQQISELADFVNRRFKAVIGMQTYMFSVKWKEGCRKDGFVHDSINAPKYHFVFDHPILLRDHLTQLPHRTCILAPDGNYVQFVKKYYGHEARFLPPAGNEVFCGSEARDYEVVFLGSYGKDLLEELRAIRNLDRKRCYFINRYILFMRKDLANAPENAFRETLAYYGIPYTKQKFVEMFHRERWVIYHLADYYRNKTIEILLNKGISLHVFGESWKRCPVLGSQKLICHQAAIGRDALKVYARAKLSLNIMTWHKDGFTERIANAMLQKSVVVTDRTTYLEKNFVNGEELLMFDLENLKKLPEQMKELLVDEAKREQIAQRGYEKALRWHTWHQRAEMILEWIEKDKG